MNSKVIAGLLAAGVVVLSGVVVYCTSGIKEVVSDIVDDTLNPAKDETQSSEA